MRSPKSRPSSRARSCSRPSKPSIRRLSSSSCESRPVTPIESTASEITIAMITTTTKISTSVKPLLGMPQPFATGRLSLIEGARADVGVVAFAARLAIASIGGDFVITPIRARILILIDVVPGIFRERRQIATGTVVRDRRVRRLFHQGLQPLFGGGILEVIQAIQVESGLNGANIALRTRDAGLVDVLQNFRHHERAEHCENDDHDHDLDEGETAVPITHDDLEN